MSLREAASLDWTARAACHGRTTLFYAEDRFSVALALRICAGCPVRPECAADARATEMGVRFGVVAGLTPDERRRWNRVQQQSSVSDGR